MKRRTLFLAGAAFIVATASAFTAPKVFNVTGFAKNSSGMIVSAPTNEANCVLDADEDCTITVATKTLSPVYNSSANVGNAADILQFN